ncbi:HNH endonuclease, partial [Klebsiella pneumoniae]|nr:HNH endonuclease [Klebsiella pneumoniae]
AAIPEGKTLNSKAVGRLLAAGGVYNGNIEGFRQTAERLGGDAVKGYDSVLNETTSGMMVAAASLLVIRNPMAAQELTSYL